MSANIRFGSYQYSGNLQRKLTLSDLSKPWVVTTIAAVAGAILAAATILSLAYSSATLSAALFTGSVASLGYSLARVCGFCLRQVEKLPPEFKERIYYNGKPLFPKS